MPSDRPDGWYVPQSHRVWWRGADAVTVESSQVIQSASKVEATNNLSGSDAMMKLKVVDEAGTYLGTISAIEIDGERGTITQLSASKGGMLGIGGSTATIDAGMIRSVGPELVMVATDGSIVASRA